MDFCGVSGLRSQVEVWLRFVRDSTALPHSQPPFGSLKSRKQGPFSGLKRGVKWQPKRWGLTSWFRRGSSRITNMQWQQTMLRRWLLSHRWLIGSRESRSSTSPKLRNGVLSSSSRKWMLVVKSWRSGDVHDFACSMRQRLVPMRANWLLWDWLSNGWSTERRAACRFDLEKWREWLTSSFRFGMRKLHEICLHFNAAPAKTWSLVTSEHVVAYSCWCCCSIFPKSRIPTRTHTQWTWVANCQTSDVSSSQVWKWWLVQEKDRPWLDDRAGNRNPWFWFMSPKLEHWNTIRQRLPTLRQSQGETSSLLFHKQPDNSTPRRGG